MTNSSWKSYWRLSFVHYSFSLSLFYITISFSLVYVTRHFIFQWTPFVFFRGFFRNIFLTRKRKIRAKLYSVYIIMTIGSSRGFSARETIKYEKKKKRNKKKDIPRMQYNVGDQSISWARNSRTSEINGNIRLFSIIVN